MKNKLVSVTVSLLLFLGLFSGQAFAIAIDSLHVEMVSKGTALPRHGVYAGLYELEIDGETTLAMCNDFNTRVWVGKKWNADWNTYSDVQAGSGKFFASRGASAYSQIGYLFSQIVWSDYNQQADIELAIWEIMSPGSLSLTGNALSLFDNATDGSHDSFDWSTTMRILTPAAGYTSQEFLVASKADSNPPVPPASPVPVPAAVWLFGSGLLGLVAVARRKK